MNTRTESSSLYFFFHTARSVILGKIVLLGLFLSINASMPDSGLGGFLFFFFLTEAYSSRSPSSAECALSDFSLSYSSFNPG